MQAFNGLGDEVKECTDFYHQYGERQDRHTQEPMDYKQMHEYQHKAEHRTSHPKLHEAKEKMRAKKKLPAKKIRNQGKYVREEKASVSYIKK